MAIFTKLYICNIDSSGVILGVRQRIFVCNAALIGFIAYIGGNVLRLHDAYKNGLLHAPNYFGRYAVQRLVIGRTFDVGIGRSALEAGLDASATAISSNSAGLAWQSSLVSFIGSAIDGMARQKIRGLDNCILNLNLSVASSYNNALIAHLILRNYRRILGNYRSAISKVTREPCLNRAWVGCNLIHLRDECRG